MSSSEKKLVICSILLTATFASSYWLFAEQPTCRVFGIAWNALFQMFAPLLGLSFCLFALAITFSKPVRRPIGIFAGAIPLGVSIAIAVKVFPVLLSV